MEKNRLGWLDIGKFIAISIMVAGHIGLPKTLSNLIHIFHMPIFFIFSGLVFDPDKYRKFGKYIASRAYGLLTPYFLYGGVTYILYSMIPSLQRNDRVITTKDFIILLFTQDASDVVFNGFGVIQWFFTCLFISSIFSWMIIWLCNRGSTKFTAKITAVILLIILAAVLDKVDFPNIIGINSAVMGCAFFILGHTGRTYFIEKDAGIHFLSGWDKIMISAIVLTAIWCLNGSTNMRIPVYNNIIMYTVGALAGTCMIIGVSSLVEKYFKKNWLYRAIAYEGQNTVIILALNRVVQKLMVEKIYNGTIYRFLYNSVMERYVYVLFGIVMELLIFIPVIYVVNRFIPFSVGRKRIRPCRLR